MKNVLILGASGNFGGAVLEALCRRPELRLRALVRPGSALVLPPGVERIEGDGTRSEDLRRACEGIDTVIYGLHTGYLNWRGTLLPAAHRMAELASELGLRVVYPGNVYGLAAGRSQALSESCDRVAPTEKGRVRNEIEDRLQEATRQGARAVIIRAGDFFGPSSRDTWLDHLAQDLRPGGSLQTPTRSAVLHAFAYLPDLGETVARILDRDEQLDDFEVFHFRGHERTPLDFMERCRALLGSRKIRLVPWWVLSIVQLFSPLMREVLRMRYLWETPVLLDQGKLARFLGEVPHTELDEALRTTFAARAAPKVVEGSMSVAYSTH